MCTSRSECFECAKRCEEPKRKKESANVMREFHLIFSGDECRLLLMDCDVIKAIVKNSFRAIN